MDKVYFRTEGLTVGYHGVPLIREIEIQLEKGRILTLIGPNGAGKTTILRSIIRQLRPIWGTVWLDGREISGMSGEELARKQAVVLTDRIRPEMMTCRDVVETGRHPYTGRLGILSGEDRRIAEEAMELVHVRDLSERDFHKISDGQKQRVMLARALCQQPELLVLDEPTSYLDIRYKAEFLSVIQKMSRSRGISVVMSLHELDLAERVSDQIACVRGDRIDRVGTPEEIFTDGYIPRLYHMTAGTYDERSGSLELPAVTGDPRVLVIAGDGRATGVFRRLQREGIPFAAGIIRENDMDYPAAKALAAELVSVGPFQEIRGEQIRRMKELARQCGRVICTLAPGEEQRRQLPEAYADMLHFDCFMKQ